MKTIIVNIILSALFLASCTPPQPQTAEIIPIKKAEKSIDISSAVIYEANIRQYSPEGTFAAFTKDIPALAEELGVKVLWLMPVYPISTTKSKGSLGSYYAVSNYKAVNPEFGNEEDLKDLIKVAHENGMYVILDWVANHTGWDHHWIKEHPDYYTKDTNGNITHTVGTDWTDVADLNYDNKNMRQEMYASMQYWLKDFNVDGFRCDVAGMVPTDFWKKTIARLREEKDIFMLAEAWEPELQEAGFDMGYGWDTHHIMNAIVKGEKTAKDLQQHLIKIDTLYKGDHILMNFVTNHDENSWNGTIKERMGDASEAFQALSYFLDGMPLIYSGQEFGLEKRLRFFEKDTIPHKKGAAWDQLKELSKLKKHKALNINKSVSNYTFLTTSNPEHIFILKRTLQDQELIFVANLSSKKRKFRPYFYGEYEIWKKSESLNFVTDTKIILEPWEYRVYTK